MPPDSNPFVGGFVYLLDGPIGDRVLTIRQWNETHDDARPDPARTSGGVAVTEELIERLSAEAAAGYDVGELQPKPGRRPRWRNHSA